MKAEGEVVLGPREIMQGAYVGMMRQVENLCKERKDAHGADEERGWQIHIEGALGEMAFAKHRGIFWSGAHGFRQSDVSDFEVRTRSKERYDLIVHKNDSDDRKFVLVTGINGKYKVWGWILGKDAKQDKWWGDPAGGRPAYFVPKQELQPFASGVEQEKLPF